MSYRHRRNNSWHRSCTKEKKTEPDIGIRQARAGPEQKKLGSRPSWHGDVPGLRVNRYRNRARGSQNRDNAIGSILLANLTELD
jgi:hypothetical protein